MIETHAHAHVALAALLALHGSLIACGPELVAPDDDGSDPIVHQSEPLPPVDLDEWCDDPVALLPFADLGPVHRLEGLGPCGHLLTWNHEDESIEWTLWYPDGRVVPLGTAPRVESDLFSPTGRLLAWAEGEFEPILRVTLRDLQTDESRTIETQELAHYGFVRIPDSEAGAALWLCTGDVLELVGVSPGDSHVLAEDVRCESVTGGELTTRLIYIDQHDVLRVVDAKAKTAWSTTVVNAGPWLRLSPDGRLAIPLHEEDSDDVLAPAVDLDRGELVASCEDLRFAQALTSTAPLFVQCDDELSVWRDEALVPVLDEVLPWTVSPSIDGSATFRRQLGIEDDEERWLAPAEDPSAARLIITYPNDELPLLYRSANGQHGRLEVETSACANASCSKTITEVHTWTPAGLGATMLAAGDWKQLHVFDDGQALGWGSRIEAPLPEGVPVPQPQLILVGPDGTATTTWSIDGEPWYAWPLDDGRLLLRGRQYGQDCLLVFDRNAPTLETLLGLVDFGMSPDFLDPRLGLLAIAVEADVGYRLHWGAVPN